MLMVLPAITYNGNDISYQYGIRELFWYGRSSCHAHESPDGSTGGDFLCHETQWVTSRGWETMLRQFVSATAADMTQAPIANVLWIFIPNYERNGEIMSIQNVTNFQTAYPEYWVYLDEIKTITEE